MADNPKNEANESSVPLLETSSIISDTPGTNSDKPGRFIKASSPVKTTVIPTIIETSDDINEKGGKALNSERIATKADYPDNTSERSREVKPTQSEPAYHRTDSTGNLSQTTTSDSRSSKQNGSVGLHMCAHKRSWSETFHPNKDLKAQLNGNTEHLSLSSSNVLRHRIRLEEIVPSTSSYLDHKESDEKEWQVDLDDFTSKRYENEEERNRLSKGVRRYYKMQDELITAFENIRLDVDDAMENAESEDQLRRMADKLAKVSFFLNLLLLIIKAIAAGLTGSLAVISSVIDSAVDLASGALMWWSNRAMKMRNIYEYPQGRTKLEPIAIMILSVIMALASVQMIRESVEKIVHYATVEAVGPEFGIPSIVICCFTVVVKLILWLVCRRHAKSPSVQALAQDHRNDVLSNSLAVTCGVIGHEVWAYADPIGALIISVYIMASWFQTGWEQIKLLTGHTARPDFLKKITWIALNHDPEVLLIDTVRAFHFGNNFLVEVDIVLPETMTLRKSHDIGETLQLKIERLPEVERAFVHLDYETEHSPWSEHKQV